MQLILWVSVAPEDNEISLSSGVAEMGAWGPMPLTHSQKIALLPIAPKFGTKEVNRFSQSQAKLMPHDAVVLAFEFLEWETEMASSSGTLRVDLFLFKTLSHPTLQK